MPAETLEPLIGHGEQLGVLRRLAAGGTLPHAFLITGPDGVGKTTFALLAAADLSCLEPGPEGAACGLCRSCQLSRAGTHPDIMRITPPREETTIGQMREMRATAGLVPVLSPRRVIIIERAETLNDQAGNAILKVLEDAPPALVLMLLAPSRESVLPTIRSRALQIPLRPVPDGEILRCLERMSVAPHDARVIAAAAGGCPGRAISLARREELRRVLSDAGDWLRCCAGASLAEALRLAAGLRELGDRARKAWGDGEDATDRQGLAWMLDALAGILQAGLAQENVTGGREAMARWGPCGVARFIAETNEARRLVLSYAQADLQLERILLRVLSLPAEE
ncbi:MAG: DNA polymerase III subunit [Armatimonadota bacterium]